MGILRSWIISCQSNICRGGLLVTLALALGGLLTSPAVAGTLEPAAGAVTGGSDPVPTMKTLDQVPPPWSQRLPWSTQANCSRFQVLSRLLSGGGGLPVIDFWGVLDRETGLVWEKSPSSEKSNLTVALHNCLDKDVGGRLG